MAKRAPGDIVIGPEDRAAPACDFCGGPQLAWIYPCQDFDLPDFGSGSVGGWAACEPCASIVETIDRPIRGDREMVERMSRLATRALDRVYGRMAVVPIDQLMASATFLFALHRAFFDNRLGPRERDPLAPPLESAP